MPLGAKLNAEVYREATKEEEEEEDAGERI